MLFAAGIVVAAAVAGTSAQMSGISAGCQSAATGLLTGPAAQCLGTAGLLTIAMTPANDSLVPPIDKWLTSTCPQPACSNATLDSVISNITSGCSTELSLTSGTTADITQYVEEWYPTGREVACLQDSSASNAYCVTTTLKAIEAYLGEPLSMNSLSGLVNKLALQADKVPTNLTCTSCVQAAYALIRPKLNDANRGTWDNFLSGQCGSNFTTGSSPSSIKQSASTSTESSTSGNGALSLSGLGVFGTALLGVAGVAILGF